VEVVSEIPPERIETDRLLIRCWDPVDAPRFKAALDSSLEELAAWIPWARDEPSPVDVLEARLRRYRDDFFGGGDALYALIDPDGGEVLGGIGPYRRVGPGALEVGYWIRTDLAGRGLASEATEALTRVGLSLRGIGRLEIRCDPRNGASVAIPQKLGYRLREVLQNAPTSPNDALGDTMVWEMTDGA